MHTESSDRSEQGRFRITRELHRISQPRWSTWSIALGYTAAIVLLVTPSIFAFSQSPTRREIPFENSRVFALLLVKVEVAGKPAILIVDTGSNQTIISPEIAPLSLRTSENIRSTSKGSGWTGAGVLSRATVRIGPVTMPNHPIVVMDMSDLSKSCGQRIDGLLGMDFFSQLRLVVIDLKNHKLIVEQ